MQAATSLETLLTGKTATNFLFLIHMRCDHVTFQLQAQYVCPVLLAIQPIKMVFTLRIDCLRAKRFNVLSSMKALTPVIVYGRRAFLGELLCFRC